jgi:hypothetical protein
MRRDVALEEIEIGVVAKLADLSLPLDARRKLEGGKVTMDIDSHSLTSQGTGTLSGIPVRFNWSESFASLGDSTRIDVQSVLDERSRPVFGFPELDWVKGAMPFKAALTGRRFHFTDIAVKADATNASTDYRLVNLKKRRSSATVSGSMHFGSDGAISIADLAVKATVAGVPGFTDAPAK